MLNNYTYQARETLSNFEKYNGVGGVYRIWLSDSHYYIGRSINLYGRWVEHLSCLLQGSHQSRMQKTYKKYQVFKPEVLFICTEEEQILKEQEMLDKYFGEKFCVNLSPHSTGGNIVEWTEEKRKEHSEIYKGVSHPEWRKEQRKEMISSNPELHARFCEILRENHDKAIAAATTPEAIARRAETQSKLFKGRKLSAEHIEKVRQAHLGRENTTETIQKMRESAKRRALEQPTVHSQETKDLISQQQKGRKWVCKEGVRKKVLPSELGRYLEQGWVLGRG